MPESGRDVTTRSWKFFRTASRAFAFVISGCRRVGSSSNNSGRYSIREPLPASEITKARVRLVIESVFSNLKLQMRLSSHLAKTLAGLAQRIAQRLLALTLGILLNLLAGRPARALVAYDGR